PGLGVRVDSSLFGWAKDSSPHAAIRVAGREMAIEFDVVLPDRPGELGRLTAALAEKSVNIDAIAAHTAFGKGYVAVLPAEPARARDALKGVGLTFTEKTVLTVQPEDRPGTLADLAKRLGAAGVDV